MRRIKKKGLKIFVSMSVEDTRMNRYQQSLD